jgi:hypothetical protein
MREVETAVAVELAGGSDFADITAGKHHCYE